ncbi:hypothetical protein QJS04_geneDACA009792 [Acorus gramineus]|uniref:Uncharacterized protein n=1 Tax=Acorus gramineus TaxID=55184 RepID=A0AAV9BEC0_ACOGR|nr:hypothetical protein QJS04_geneDACA009792 [Acorus gramineus]
MGGLVDDAIEGAEDEGLWTRYLRKPSLLGCHATAAAFDGGGGGELGLELLGDEAHLLGDASGLAGVLLSASFPLLWDRQCGSWWWWCFGWWWWEGYS